MKLLICLPVQLMMFFFAHAQVAPPTSMTSRIQDSAGNQLTSTGVSTDRGLDVFLLNPMGTVAASLRDGSNLPFSSVLTGGTRSLSVKLVDDLVVNVDMGSTAMSINVASDRPIGGSQGSIASLIAGSNAGAVRPVRVDLDGTVRIAGTTAVSNFPTVQDARILSGTIALPVGASTSTNQLTSIATLGSINLKLNSLGQKDSDGSVPVVIAADQSPIPITGSIAVTMGTSAQQVMGTVSIENFPELQDVAVVRGTISLPVNAATESNQVSGNLSLSAIDANTASIDGKLNSLGQKPSADSVPVVIADDQSPVAVDVTFPAIQQVSGTVNVVGGSGTTAVTQASFPWITSGTHSIANFPEVQQVSGTVSVSVLNQQGTVSVLQASFPWLTLGTQFIANFPASQNVNGTVAIDNFPDVQSVNGTVGVEQSSFPWYTVGTNAISNFPAIQQVTGTINVGNFPAIQPVSGTLSVSVLNPLGTVTVNQGTSPWLTLGTSFIANFPASQTVNGTVSVLQSTSPWITRGTVDVSGGTVGVLQVGTWTVGRTWNLSSAADSVTAVGTLGANILSGTISLPVGASTLAGQGTTNTILSGTLNTSVVNFPAVQFVNGTLGLSPNASTLTAQGTANVTLGSINLTMGSVNAQLATGTIQTNSRINLTGGSHAVITLAGTSSIVLTANANRIGAVFTNSGLTQITFGLGTTAVNLSGIVLYPGGVFTMDPMTYTTAAIHAIPSSATGGTLSIQELNR